MFFLKVSAVYFLISLIFYELTPAAAFKCQLIPLAADLQHPSKPDAERAQVWNKPIPSAESVRSGIIQNWAVTREPLEWPAAGHSMIPKEQE